MKVSLVAALAKNRVIGNHNQLPWRLPADLRHFKAVTLGKPIIMGRKTFASIGRPLPGRRNIIISSNPAFTAPGCDIVHSLAEALAVVDVPEIMVIGGAQIYEQTLAIANRLYLTLIQENFPGDAYFPAWNSEEWQEISREDHQRDENNPHDYSFVVLERQATEKRR